jgi:hypothetical protein
VPGRITSTRLWFSQHKGYGTRAHLGALGRWPAPVHRAACPIAHYGNKEEGDSKKPKTVCFWDSSIARQHGKDTPGEARRGRHAGLLEGAPTGMCRGIIPGDNVRDVNRNQCASLGY